MISLLAPWLSELWSPLHVFSYITVRTMLAAACAFFLAVWLGKPVIRYLLAMGVQEDAGASDAPAVGAINVQTGKHRTPTMGGVFWTTAILVSTLLFARPDEILVLLGATLLVGMGLVGFLDDLIKWRREDRRNGLSRTAKMVVTLSLAAYVALMLWLVADKSGKTELATLYFPLFKTQTLGPDHLGLWLLPLFVLFHGLLILATTHAVNITDGLDGLAAGTGLIVTAALSFTLYAVSYKEFADYLKLPHIPGAGEVAVMGGAVLGATLGFLWYNCHPAQVFMGDSGSLPMGAILAYMAIVAKQEFILPVFAAVFVVEAASSLLQISYFKWSGGKRLFSIAPLHHVFQLRGVPESRIVVRFWICGVVAAGLGFILIKAR